MVWVLSLRKNERGSRPFLGMPSYIYYVEVVELGVEEVAVFSFGTLEEAYEWIIFQYHSVDPFGSPQLIEVVRNEIVDRSRYEASELVAETDTLQWRLGRKLNAVA